jgi:hypothetical protein
MPGQLRRWTAAEVEDLHRMRADGHSLGTIARALGRTVGSVAGRWKEEQERGNGVRGGAILVPPSVEADRERRRALEHARDPIAALLGEPLPGCSALDRRPGPWRPSWTRVALSRETSSEGLG